MWRGNKIFVMPISMPSPMPLLTSRLMLRWLNGGPKKLGNVAKSKLMSMGRIKTEATSWRLQLLLLLLQFDIMQNIIIFQVNKKDDKNGDIWDRTKWHVLSDLVLFVPFRKHEKHSWRIVTFKQGCRLKFATLLKVGLLYGWLPRFLNCTNGTKLRNLSQISLEIKRHSS